MQPEKGERARVYISSLACASRREKEAGVFTACREGQRVSGQGFVTRLYARRERARAHCTLLGRISAHMQRALARTYGCTNSISLLLLLRGSGWRRCAKLLLVCVCVYAANFFAFARQRRLPLRLRKSEVRFGWASEVNFGRLVFGFDVVLSGEKS